MWMERQQNCPLCRREFDNRVVQVELIKMGAYPNEGGRDYCAKILGYDGEISGEVLKTKEGEGIGF